MFRACAVKLEPDGSSRSAASVIKLRLNLFRRWPLWARLTLAFLGAILLFRVISYIAVSEFTERAFLESYTVDSQNVVSMIDAAVIEDSRGKPALKNGFFEPRFQAVGSGFYWTVRFDDGTAIFSPSLGDKELPLLQASNSQGKAETQTPMGRLFQVQKRFPARSRLPAYTIDVAISMAEINDRIDRTNTTRAFISGASVFGLIILGAIILWWTSRHLRRVSREINEIADGMRHELSDNYPSDIQNVADKFNDILQNHRNAFDQASLILAAFNHNIRSSLAKILYEVDHSVTTQENLAQQGISAQIMAIQRDLASYTNSFRSPELQYLMLKPPMMDVETALEDIFVSAQKVHQYKHLDWYLGDGPSVRFPCDDRTFRNMLFNLLDNAGKWARHQVACTWTLNDGSLSVMVEDDGPGLGASAGKDNNEGMGVGLQIARELVAMLGGTIESGTSQLGGAQFSVNIPVNRSR